MIFPAGSCTCLKVWGSIMPPPPCPVHSPPVQAPPVVTTAVAGWFVVQTAPRGRRVPAKRRTR